MKTLESLCIEYITVVYEMFSGSVDGIHVEILDNERVELHNEIVALLKIPYEKESELNRILHALNIMIGFPMNEYHTQFRDKPILNSNLEKHGKKLRDLLEKTFKNRRMDAKKETE